MPVFTPKANEAGKSTVRSAILDLLYGFPKSTAYAFVHPMPDLRLGATIEHNGETLEFHRTKGYKATLRTPKDGQLPDGVLAPLLGTANREFFEQMFGLDHERLVEGGAGILSASNDLGQILFEAAAGIDSLGDIRTSLEEEAGRLWSKRKSGERAYYRAEEAFERAKMALKSATLRTKDWAEAHSSVEDLAERLEKPSKRSSYSRKGETSSSGHGASVRCWPASTATAPNSRNTLRSGNCRTPRAQPWLRRNAAWLSQESSGHSKRS